MNTCSGNRNVYGRWEDCTKDHCIGTLNTTYPTILKVVEGNKVEDALADIIGGVVGGGDRWELDPMECPTGPKTKLTHRESVIAGCMLDSEATQIWLMFRAELTFDTRIMGIIIGLHMLNWWEGVNNEKWFSFGHVWGVLGIGMKCPYYICMVGLGGGIKFQRAHCAEDDDPDDGSGICYPPNATAIDNAVEVHLNLFAQFRPLEIYVDIKIRNLGYTPICYSTSRTKSYAECKDEGDAWPNFERLDIMVAKGSDGEIGQVIVVPPPPPLLPTLTLHHPGNLCMFHDFDTPLPCSVQTRSQYV